MMRLRPIYVLVHMFILHLFLQSLDVARLRTAHIPVFPASPRIRLRQLALQCLDISTKSYQGVYLE